MEEYYYKIVCEMCETTTFILVYEEDEFPTFCTMCGEEIQAEEKPGLPE